MNVGIYEENKKKLSQVNTTKYTTEKQKFWKRRVINCSSVLCCLCCTTNVINYKKWMIGTSRRRGQQSCLTEGGGCAVAQRLTAKIALPWQVSLTQRNFLRRKKKYYTL